MKMQVVQFINLTSWSITLIHNGAPILDNFKPAESKKSLIITPDHESSSSNSVQILKDGHHANVRISQSGLTKSPIIVFKSEAGEYGEKVLLVDGIYANKHIDTAALQIMKIGRLVGKVWWCRGKRPTTNLIARESESPYVPEAYSVATLNAL